MAGVQRRGRLITYNRHSQKAVGSFTNEPKVSEKERMAKSPSRLQKPVVSPARITKLQSSSKNADLFEVPSSDDEMPPRKRLLGKFHRLRDGTIPSPTGPRLTQHETQTKSGLSQSMASSQTPKKRKRTHRAVEIIVSHAGIDVARQVPAQAREKKSQKPMDPKCSTPLTASTKVSHSLQGITSSIATGMPLQAMLSKQHSRTEITRSMNVAPSIPTTPTQPPQVVQRTPSTPPGQTETAATPSTQRKYLTTPRQAQLWSNLLGNGLTLETTNHPETPPSTPPGQTEAAATPSTRRRCLAAQRQAQRWSNLHSNTATVETTGHPETLPSTPPGQTESAAKPSTLRRCITAPRQAQLWSSLLDNEMTSDTINHLETLDLGKRIVCSNQNSTSHRENPRRKLVDILGSRSKLFCGDMDGQEAQSDEEEILDDEGIKPRVITEDADQVERISHSYHARPIDLPPLQQQTTVPSGPKITYAGQRSYLDDTTLALESLLEQPFDLATCPELVRPRQQRHNNRTRVRPDLVDILEEEQSGNHPTQSIHELRAFGDTRWFTDEIDMLLEDLDCGKDASISRKRSALLEFCNKLKDSSFKSHFIHNGFEQVISRCKGESDIIFSTTLATILVMVLDATIEPQSLLQSYKSSIIEILVKILEYEEDIITISKHRHSNMSRAAQGAVVQYRALVVGLSVWKSAMPHVVSPRIMALRSLELLVRKLREAGSKEIILNDRLLERLLGVMEQSLRHVMKMANKVTTAAFTELELSLSILETCTIAHECASNLSIWSTKRLRQLANTLDLVLNSVPLEPASIITLALRLCCNLANNSERNANLFVKLSLIRRIIAFVNTGFERVQALATKSDEPARFDVLLLSLGAMINLAEWSDAIRQVVIQNRENLLDPLLRSFLGNRDGASVVGSLEASQANVAYGYLAVLLGNLSQNNDIRMLITSKVPKGLEIICEAVEEFIQCHKEADSHEDADDVWAAFTDRLQLVAERLKSFKN